MPPFPIITLLTDFGTCDAYVGTMKGVIAGIAPGCLMVDLTHEVPRQATAVAAMLLGDALPFFPPGTIHLVVVDPGVGSARRAIAVETGAAVAVGPDNGCLTPAIDGAIRVVEIRDARLFRSPVSATFQGRDLFAPVAAHIARGTPVAALGPEIADPLRAALAAPHAEEGALIGEVAHVDRFGNLITTVRVVDLAGWPGVEVEVAGVKARGLAGSYHDGAGEAGASGGAAGVPRVRALIGSAGRLEIALPDGSAAELLGAGRGARIVVRKHEHD
jgi:hypothetical protein